MDFVRIHGISRNLKGYMGFHANVMEFLTAKSFKSQKYGDFTSRNTLIDDDRTEV